MYLIKSDYRKQIQDVNLNQIITNDETVLDSAQLAAQSECLSYLRQRYDITQEFTDTNAWNYNAVYGARDRVYLDADTYYATSTYALKDLTLYNGYVYQCSTAITVGETFNPAHWTQLGKQYTIYYAVYPKPIFRVKGFYNIGDQVYWGGHTYQCKVQTRMLSHESTLQYESYRNIPPTNIFPDDPIDGPRYWTDLGAYTIAAHTDITNTTYWKQGDNRDQQLVMYMIDITLFHIHSRIAPRNVPQLRIDRYTNAVTWLTMAANGGINAGLPLLQPDQGNRIRYGGNIKNNNSY